MMASPKSGSAEVRPHERLAQSLRDRVQGGVWQVGEMIPARRALAKEHQVALATVEKAVHTLISEGYLRADDRRGTFVASQGGETGHPQRAFAQSRCECTVGLISEIVPYKSIEMRESQWNAQILRACEQAFSREEGITLNFVNLVPHFEKPITMERAVGTSLEAGSQLIVFIGSRAEELVKLGNSKDLPPVVCVNFDPVPAPIPQVYIDSSVGGALAVRHLRQRGFENLVFLRPFITTWVENRLEGAQTAVAGEALRIFPDVPLKTFSLDRQGEIGRQLASEILARPLLPKTAIIAPNDLLAKGFMDEAADMGFAAGDDYGILGFDDRQREAQLTSLRPPLEQMGEEAARLALLQLRGAPCPSRVALPHSLIARASTRLVAS